MGGATLLLPSYYSNNFTDKIDVSLVLESMSSYVYAHANAFSVASY